MLQIKSIEDKGIWEKFIEKHSPQSLFQSWNWGETIKKVQSSLRSNSWQAKFKVYVRNIHAE